MEVQTSKMQLSSFLGQLGRMIEAQTRSARSLQETVEEIKEEAEPEKLMSLGAFAALYLSDTDRAIAKATDLINKAVAPLPLDAITQPALPLYESPDAIFSDEIAKLIDRNEKQVRVISQMEKRLLELSDKEIRNSYPRKSLQDLTRSWEKQLQDFMKEGS